MAGQKKRTAWSVQDVLNGAGEDNYSAPSPNARFKSGYSGPKKSNSAVMDKINAESRRGGQQTDEVERLANQKRSRYQSSGNSMRRSGRPSSMQGANDAGYAGNGSNNQAFAVSNGIFDYAWILFAVILSINVILAVSLYSANGSKGSKYTYPSHIFTFNGVLNSIYDDYANGGLGSNYKAAEEVTQEEVVDKGSLLGDTTNNSSLPNTTTGATMALDAGGTYADYNIAVSHEELISQVTRALEANDFGFIGMKFAYEDDNTGELIGYPQSVVEHFTKYMSDNTGKRELFLSEISDASTYSVKNGAAYLVKLPILKFTINMGYDNTNVSISGFSDQKMDAGQSAVVSPLLPCMYTITVTTDGGSQSSEVECDMSEGNLQVNIGVTN